MQVVLAGVDGEHATQARIRTLGKPTDDAALALHGAPHPVDVLELVPVGGLEGVTLDAGHRQLPEDVGVSDVDGRHYAATSSYSEPPRPNEPSGEPGASTQTASSGTPIRARMKGSSSWVVWTTLRSVPTSSDTS